MKFLCWFSFARSGSNYLSDLLSAFEGVTSFREVFQSGGVHAYNSNSGSRERQLALQTLGRKFGIEVEDVRDASLVSLVRNHPGKFFDAFAESSEYPSDEVFSLKIFEGHLAEDKISAEILPRKDLAAVVLIRPPLDTFISAQKVTVAKKAIAIDTTSIKPELDFAKFARWRERREAWINFINANASAFSGYLDYERITDGNRSNTMQTLNSALHMAGLENIRLARTQDFKTTERQDKASAPAEKVSNFDQFLKDCQTAGINPHREPVALQLPSLVPES